MVVAEWIKVFELRSLTEAVIDEYLIRLRAAARSKWRENKWRQNDCIMMYIRCIE